MPLAGAGRDKWLSVICSGDGSVVVAGQDVTVINNYNTAAYLYMSTDGGSSFSRQLSTNPYGWGSNWRWSTLASSTDGHVVFAGQQNGGNILKSTKSGLTFNHDASPGVAPWRSVASSSDGMKLVAVQSPSGYVYTSSNGGESWTPRTSSGLGDWQAVAGE